MKDKKSSQPSLIVKSPIKPKKATGRDRARRRRGPQCMVSVSPARRVMKDEAVNKVSPKPDRGDIDPPFQGS